MCTLGLQVWSPAGLRGACSGCSKVARADYYFTGLLSATSSRLGPSKPHNFNNIRSAAAVALITPALKLSTFTLHRCSSSTNTTRNRTDKDRADHLLRCCWRRHRLRKHPAVRPLHLPGRRSSSSSKATPKNRLQGHINCPVATSKQTIRRGYHCVEATAPTEPVQQ